MAAVPQRRRSWRNTIAAVVVLTPVVAFVVYSSFRVSEIECEVCMRFEGGEVCRSASAALRDEALRSAIDNACALLTSGMTNTIRCQQGEPAKARCRSLTGNSLETAP
jgi:hypothetical protein